MRRIFVFMLVLTIVISCIGLVGFAEGTIEPITDFPEPAEFGIQVSMPNPFISWEGTEVTADNWDARAAQIKQIMQHYETGYCLPTDGITLSLVIIDEQTSYEDAANGAGHAEIIVSKDGVAAPTTIKFSFFLPDPEKFPVPEDGYPVLMNATSSWLPDTPVSVGNFYRLATDFGIAVVAVDVKSIDSGDNEVGSYRGNDRAGVVNELFNILDKMPIASRTEYSAGNVDNRWLPPYFDGDNTGDPDAPDLMVCQTWGISRVLDVFEQDMARPAEERQLNLCSTKSGLTGMSRLGKLTLVAGAYETRLAVVNPVSSGSGGVVIDRFTSVAVNEAQYYGLEPSMGGEYPINKYYYYAKIEEEVEGTFRCTVVLPTDALIDVNGRLDGGTTATSEYQDYDNFNDFISGVKVAEGDINPYAKNELADLTTGVGHGNNIKPGYCVINYGIQTGEGIEQGWHQGTQNLLDVRWAYGSWLSARFRQFPVLEQFKDVDIIKRANRGEYGHLPNIPFDQHYLMALVAPRGLLIQDGILSNNTNPEGTYFGYLAAREVYRFLGAENKIGMNLHLINHANPLREVLELGEFMTAIVNGQEVPEKFSYQTFPINDPRSLYDYARLDWSAPGYESIADQVAAIGLAEDTVSETSIYAK